MIFNSLNIVTINHYTTGFSLYPQRKVLLILTRIDKIADIVDFGLAILYRDDIINFNNQKVAKGEIMPSPFDKISAGTDLFKEGK